MRGHGFCGGGQRYGAGNPFPYCRYNPSLPSRRAMSMGVTGNTSMKGVNEINYLKNTAAWLNSQLEAVNKRLSDLNVQA